VQFSGCTSGGRNCSTAGSAVGEIHRPRSTLFDLGLASLTPTTGQIPAILVLIAEPFFAIECEGTTIEVKKSVIGALQMNGKQALLNTPFLDINLNFQQTANGLQHLRLFLLPGSTGLSTWDLELRIGIGRMELASLVVSDLLNAFLSSAGKPVDLELVEP
jgi:hypothetical protein